MQTEENKPIGMLDQVRLAREEAKHTAKTGEGGNEDGQAEELPEGSSPLEARASTPEVEEATPEEAPEKSASTETEGEEDTLIRIGDREFRTEKEAIAYARELEREKLLTEAHAAGVREALEATRQPAQPEPEPEDNFEERFYANPKETLAEIEQRAIQRAIQTVKQEQQREALWNQFLGENPDLRRKDAERVLQENWDTIGKMTDITKAMKVLAQKVRSEYEEIRDLAKPRTELANKSGRVSAPTGEKPRGVTPAKKDDGPIDFASEMRRLFKR